MWLPYVHPLYVELLSGFREVSRDLSLRDSMIWMLTQLKAEVRITSGECLKTGPTLFLSNHHSPLDGAVMWATIDRDDAHMIGAPGWRILGPKVAERHLPVYMSQKRDRNPLELFRTYVFARFTEGLTREEARKRNQQTIARACETASAGSAIFMAPTGGTFFGHRWKTGLGHVINGIDNLKTQIQFIRIKGASRRDIFRFLNPYVFGPLLRRLIIDVDISQPIPLTEFQDRSSSPRDVSLRVKAWVEQMYEWF